LRKLVISEYKKLENQAGRSYQIIWPSSPHSRPKKPKTQRGYVASPSHTVKDNQHNKSLKTWLLIFLQCLARFLKDKSYSG
jgi:hypothetical protein